MNSNKLLLVFSGLVIATGLAIANAFVQVAKIPNDAWEDRALWFGDYPPEPPCSEWPFPCDS